MHINWPTTLSLPDYSESQLQTSLQRRVSEATDDDLLAAFLHWTAGQIALDFMVEAEFFAEKVQAAQDQLEGLVVPAGKPNAVGYRYAHAILRRVLKEAGDAVASASRQATDVLLHLRDLTVHDLTSGYRAGAEASPSGLECIGKLRTGLLHLERGVARAHARHRDEMHHLALVEEALDRFLASDDSMPLERIHAMTPNEFEQAVAALARRDGHQIIRESGGARDLGADVIAITPISCASCSSASTDRPASARSVHLTSRPSTAPPARSTTLTSSSP